MLARTRANDEREALCTILGVAGNWGGLTYRETRLQVGQPGGSRVAVIVNRSTNGGGWVVTEQHSNSAG